jgi:hypothetical protein
VVAKKKLRNRAIWKSADSAHIAEASDRELERLGEPAIGKASARHRSPPKEAAAARLCREYSNAAFVAIERLRAGTAMSETFTASTDRDLK